MIEKDLLFLGGFGAPVFLYEPWFASLKSQGYRVHVIPNSLLTTDPVSTFAERFIERSRHVRSFDAIGVSYGGTAALYGACVSEALSAKVDKMITVYAPLLGIPPRIGPLAKLAPGPLSKVLEELVDDGLVTKRLRDPEFHKKIDFDLHCIYHERDSMAPLDKATLPGVGTSHRLEFDSRIVPGFLMHQVAAVNPKTLKMIVRILTRD